MEDPFVCPHCGADATKLRLLIDLLNAWDDQYEEVVVIECGPPMLPGSSAQESGRVNLIGYYVGVRCHRGP